MKQSFRVTCGLRLASRFKCMKSGENAAFYISLAAVLTLLNVTMKL